MSESGREALKDVQEWSGGSPKCLGVVGRPSQICGSGREALPEVREALPDIRKWSGEPSRFLRVV